MNQKIGALTIILITCGLLIRSETLAAELECQPRLESGFMFYSIESSALSKTTLTIPGEAFGYSSGQDKVEYSDNIGFIGGGVTFFIDRIFVDLSAQCSFDGSDRSQASISEYDEGDINSFASAQADYHGRFNRADQAVAAGYTVSGAFSLFAGYKWAGVDLDTRFDGPASLLNIDNWVANGRYSGQEHYRFKYEGPFIGVVHGSEINHPGFFQGLVSVKLGVAFLRSKLSRNRTDTLTFDTLNGQEIEPLTTTTIEDIEVKGETVGLTLGIDWRGATPIKNLSYSVGASGYRYNFNSDNSDFSDITETVVTLRVALGYVF